MMNLSIIVPVYNTPIDKLRVCLHSIIKFINFNKELNIECLIIDDGSTESISDWCCEFASNYSNFKFYKKQNEGVSIARNTGIELSKGEYITFVDSDDILLPIEDLSKYLLSQKYDLLFTDLKTNKQQNWFAFSGEKNREIEIETVIARLVENGTLNGPYCKFIRGCLLRGKAIKFDYKMIIGEDLVFLIHLLLQLPKMYYIPQCSYIYNLDNATSNNRLISKPNIIIDNNNRMYQAMIKLISNTLPMEKQFYYKVKATERMVKQLFNTAADLITMKMFSKDSKCGIRTSLLQIDENIRTVLTKSRYSKSSIRLSILLNQKWSLLAIIGKIRLIYLNLKNR